jgi:rfaE bifunctional protein nucleotidyltransferase chain/domain
LAQVISQDNLILQRRKWKDNGQCVVFVAGQFDLLHPGHIRLLEQARSHGDILVVAVQSDASVRSLSGRESGAVSSSVGSSRPVNPAVERAEILAALAAVDYVVEFDESSADGLIARLAPDIVVKGASQQSALADLAEDRLTESVGAKIVRILIEPGYSTTRLIERITQAGA